MPHVVTQSCCSDASCVYACPVNCIHPTPDEPDFATAEMLHIDPTSCVDCGACVTACPVDAIKPQAKLTPAELPFVELNADFYRNVRDEYPILAPVVHTTVAETGGVRVAIVGSGPAAMYAADEILKQPGARVNVFDRLPVPFGLARSGVAPDHQRTKQVTELFDSISAEDGFEFFLNVEVGKHISHEELLTHHHAVIYAVGASSDRRLDIPGADLPGVASATEFVGWYNGHPDHVHREFDLTGQRVVIVGNGNVALDVARILASDPERLAGTDITRDALAALRKSSVQEVVVVGRRGPAQSAFTMPELAGLIAAEDLDVVVDRESAALDSATAAARRAGTLATTLRHKLDAIAALRNAASADPARRRIVLRYLLSPTAVLGDEQVRSVKFAPGEFTDAGATSYDADSPVRFDTGLLLTSIGYYGLPVADMPYDPARGIIPNTAGRVGDPDASLPGTYVTGWAKRGPTGFLGTNKSCAHETTENLIDDLNAGLLRRPTRAQSDLVALVRSRRPEYVNRTGWAAVDRAERSRGTDWNRVRDKIIDIDEATRIAHDAQAPRRRFGLRRGR
ncbi:FAD-dependent oxidoreductase [Aldersonia sp. NBC_00410]|uniref:FAD-dependent oxidoreductase n=1 Tax=Aldersonia sp. NBC_00410 TaxID=2975954 RepID=UPI00224E0E7C|nr:FAD-dependent oxidoreductase [Aldersonia sp. NBC_00410]MCX5043282.1 FAD-dependent oxidoreductase [Aldersonia sp. NBC_00410]